MTSEINIGLAQINVIVGGIENNVDRIIEFAERARDDLSCDLLVCSELVITGYPPEDLLAVGAPVSICFRHRPYCGVSQKE